MQQGIYIAAQQLSLYQRYTGHVTSSFTARYLLPLKSFLPVNLQFRPLNIQIQSLMKYTKKHPALPSCLAHAGQL